MSYLGVAQERISTMDEIAKYNIERWKALAGANALYTRPALNLDAESARELVDPEGRLGELAGRRVLCLAGGGGKQSAAFALLGASVTVYDLSEAQLERDRQAAAHYNVRVETVQGDMRDLSCFADAAFDIVQHSYSINFVPDARAVFRQVARVMRRGGVYYVMCANPFLAGMGTKDWNGAGYTLSLPYVGGSETVNADEGWVYDRSESTGDTIAGSREFRHTLSAVVGGLVEHGFVIRHVSDDDSMHPDLDAPPGTWDHFVAHAPPWLTFWTEYRPEVFGQPGAQSTT